MPLAEKYLESMGLGVNPKVVHAAQFAKMLGEGKVDARRIAFVLDTTIAEEALQKAADEAAAAEAEAPAAEAPAEEEEKGFVKENLESIKHLRYSNAVNSVGMLRMTNIICDKTDDAVQAFVLYKDMTIPGILERFYKKMQDRLGLMMTKADVTDIRDAGNHMVVSCKNTLLGMDFDLDVDLVVLPTGVVPTTAKDVVVEFDYRQGPDFPDLQLFDGFADSNYICFPYETRRTGVYAAGCVRQPQTLDACEEDARGAVLKSHPVCGSRFPRCGRASPLRRQFLPGVQLRALHPVQALHRRMSLRRPGRRRKGTPKPNPARCRRCGTCFGACP